jgi:VanZ family protein
MTRSLSTRTAWVIFIVLVVLLVAGTTMPARLKTGIESHMWHVLPWSALAHFTLFMLIGLCPVYGKGRAAVLRTVSIGLALAIMTESLQALVPGRSPQVRDVLIDLCGTTLALVMQQVARSSKLS